MFRTIFLSGIVFYFLSGALAQPYKQMPAFSNQPGFVENHGQNQATEKCLYYFENQNFRLSLYQDGFSYHLFGERDQLYYAGTDNNFSHKQTSVRDNCVEISSVKIILKGANKKALVEGQNRSKDYLRFYEQGENMSAFHYQKITYKEIYPHIDLAFHTTEQGQGIKYDFIVKPGGNPKDIQLNVQGANELSIETDGSLSFITDHGKLTEATPVSFLLNDPQQNPVKTKYTLDNQAISFEVENYNSSQTLVIDPEVIWYTYYGGLLQESLSKVALDSNENIIIVGSTFSSNNISDNCGTFTSGENGFLAKFDKNGCKLWSCYFGNDRTKISTVATDSDNNIIIGGFTTDPGLGGPASTGNGFIAKLGPSGNLLWLTPYGGAGKDSVSGIAVDINDNIYVTGWTSSPNLSLFSPTHQNTLIGTDNAFLGKIPYNGSTFSWATYYGAQKTKGLEIAVNSMGEVVFTGRTNSPTGIATINDPISGTTMGYDTSHNGLMDAIVIGFDTNGYLKWGTYYGGPQPDEGPRYCLG